ncbi:MAG: hypothetical protein SFY80_16235 [Verrucomicrobiota bacterium]|nr:hypothetical protein [Verrucomicrobiota bacterium]
MSKRVPYSLTDKFLVFWIICGLLLRIDSVFTNNPMTTVAYVSDCMRHWDHAKDTLNFSPSVLFDPIVYQSWMSLVQKFCLADPTLAAIYGALLSLSCPLAWGYFFKELPLGRTLRLFGMCLIAFLPTWIGIYSYFMQETLFLPLLGLAFGLSWRALRKNDLHSFLLVVFVWILTGLTRGVGIPMAAVTVSTLWFVQKGKLPRAIYSTLILALILGPLALRSHTFCGLWSPHGSGVFNKLYCISGKQRVEMHLSRDGAGWYYIYESPMMRAYPFKELAELLPPKEDPNAPDSAFRQKVLELSRWTTARQDALVLNVDLRKGMTDWNTAAAGIELTFDQRCRWIKENLLCMFFGASWPDDNPAFYFDHLAVYTRWFWLPLFIVVFALLLFRWKHIGFSGYLISANVLFWLYIQCFSLVVINEGRYRKPLEGLLITLILILIATWKSKTPDKKPADAPSELPKAAKPEEQTGEYYAI